MHRQHAGEALVRGIVVVVAAVLVVGCGKKAKTDTAGGSTQAVGASAVAGGSSASGPCDNPSDLPTTGPTLESAPGGVAAFVGNLKFTGHGDTKNLGPDAVPLTILPEDRANRTHRQCIQNPAYGYVVAKMDYARQSSQDFSPWASSGTTSDWKHLDHVPVYLWVGKSGTAGGDFTWRVFKIVNNQAVDVTESGAGIFYKNAALGDSAQWGTPSLHTADTTFMARLAKLAASHPAHGRAWKRSAPNDGTAWFECDQGCCTASSLF